MTPPAIRPGLICGVLAAITLLISPVAATLVLSDEVLSPATIPLIPAMDQRLDAKIAISPSGATTFEKGHSLQMQTGMMNATWNMQVFTDGIPAAHQSAEGSAMFVSGYLLSYTTNCDVSVSVTVWGIVPADAAGSSIVLLVVQELDNSGMPVHGSAVTISQPVASPAGVSVTATSPVAKPAPTKAGGFCLFTGFIALVMCAVFLIPDKKLEK